MTVDLMRKVDQGAFQDLFIEDLNWHAPRAKPVGLTADDGRRIEAANIASYEGLTVWLCPERPGSALEAELDRLIAKTSTDRLVIFDGSDEQVWRWPVRRTKEQAVTSRLTSHRHRKGDADPKFAARLEVIRMPFDTVLDANSVLQRVRQAFDVESQNESKYASKLMATMYSAIEKAYPQATDPKMRDHEISVTLARILFLMFGDDTEMWETDAFRNVVQHGTRPDGSDLATVLNTLFTFLDTAQPGSVPPGFEGFKYVNGGIFGESIELPSLNRDFREAILAACAIDWSTISPAIFGSMFQSVRDADTRRALGEHYTSEENILKTLNPLFLDDLRAQYVEALARETPQKQINALKKLWDRLAGLRYMDPACGCGNFIIVAYRELRDIELRVMQSLYDLRGRHQLSLDATRELRVTLDHFYGIEIDEWPARIAETAMFMIDRQCDLKLRERFGEAPQRLPIQREARIVVGNALRLDWAAILSPSGSVVVAGNPPFLGHNSRTKDQSTELRDLWRRDDIGRLDYVTGWYAKALDYFRSHPGRWAFVSTSSVCQGEPVPTLFGAVFDAGWRIRFAHQVFPWESEATGAAAVHCIIVGFDRSSERALLVRYRPDGSELERRTVPKLNAYLHPGPNVLVEQRRSRLAPDLRPFNFGSRPNDGGALVVEADQVAEVQADPVASKYLRRFVGARELVHGLNRWCLWLVDLDPEDITRSAVLQERLERCRAHRLKSKRPATREWADRPHLFDFNSQPDTAYVCIPGLASEKRPFILAARHDPNVIASNLAYTAVDPDGALFGLISSSMFISWQRAVGGRLESRLRFSNTIVWNNFPVPRLAGSAREAIVEAGTELEMARAGLEPLSLAVQYQDAQLPEPLAIAHRSLDLAVDQALNFHGGSEEDRIGHLFELYETLNAEGAGS